MICISSIFLLYLTVTDCQSVLRKHIDDYTFLTILRRWLKKKERPRKTKSATKRTPKVVAAAKLGWVKVSRTSGLPSLAHACCFSATRLGA